MVKPKSGGCEHYPDPEMVMRAIDEAVRAVVPELFADPKLQVADPKFQLNALIGLQCGDGSVTSEVLTSQISQVREVIALQVESAYGREARAAVLEAMTALVGCSEGWSCSEPRTMPTEACELPQEIDMFRNDETVDGCALRSHEEKEELQQQEEADDFKRLHCLVSEHSKSLAEVSKALREIRERKLYRACYANFEDYCQQSLGLSRQYVNNLIKAGDTLAEMETIVSMAGAPLPSNESQLRELARVQDVEERCRHYLDLWEKVQQDGGEVTARRIREHLDGIAKGNDVVQDSAPLTPKQRIKEALVVLGELENEIGGDAKAVELLARLKKLLGD